MQLIRQITLNADDDGCASTLTCAHSFIGNILYPRQGFRQLGVLEVWQK
ncbi:MAG: hypothetical protein KBT34_10590 [Prevotella sp.]|nr:hypothetical protein [Candidatus Prevotella equi]